MHTKFLIIDHFNMIFQLIKDDKKDLISCLKNVIRTLFVLNKQQNFNLKIDTINLDTLFNNFLIFKELTLAFLDIMIELDSDTNSKNK